MGRHHPKHELEAGGQPVLQATSSAKTPKTMNTEIRRGLRQSARPLRPDGPLHGEVDDHFCGHARASTFFERSAVIHRTNLKHCRGAAGSAGNRLSEEPKNDEHGNSERLGAECNTSPTKTAPCRAMLMIIFAAMLVPQHFSSGVRSSTART